MFLLGQGETGRSRRPGVRFYTDSFTNCIWVVMRGDECCSATHLDWPGDFEGLLAREGEWFGRPLAELSFTIYHRPQRHPSGGEMSGAKEFACALASTLRKRDVPGGNIMLHEVSFAQYGITSLGCERAAGERVIASPYLGATLEVAKDQYRKAAYLRRISKATEPTLLPEVVFDDGFRPVGHTLPESVRVIDADEDVAVKAYALFDLVRNRWRRLSDAYVEQGFDPATLGLMHRQLLIKLVGDARLFKGSDEDFTLSALLAAEAAFRGRLVDRPARYGWDYDTSWVRPATVCDQVSPCCALAFAATAVVVGAAAWWLSLSGPELS